MKEEKDINKILADKCSEFLKDMSGLLLESAKQSASEGCTQTFLAKLLKRTPSIALNQIFQEMEIEMEAELGKWSDLEEVFKKAFREAFNELKTNTYKAYTQL